MYYLEITETELIGTQLNVKIISRKMSVYCFDLHMTLLLDRYVSGIFIFFEFSLYGGFSLRSIFNKFIGNRRLSSQQIGMIRTHKLVKSDFFAFDQLKFNWH